MHPSEPDGEKRDSSEFVLVFRRKFFGRELFGGWLRLLRFRFGGRFVLDGKVRCRGCFRGRRLGRGCLARRRALAHGPHSGIADLYSGPWWDRLAGQRERVI